MLLNGITNLRHTEFVFFTFYFNMLNLKLQTNENITTGKENVMNWDESF